MPRSDEAELGFFAFPGASLTVSLVTAPNGARVLQLHGNRAALASLANALLWLHANGWRREFLSVTSLQWVTAHGAASLMLHLVDAGHDDDWGSLLLADKACQYEWLLSDESLRRVALDVHHIASNPAHEYDRMSCGDFDIEIRMVDALEHL